MFKLKETTELDQNQIEFLERFIPLKVIGCFDVRGVGKTLEILAAICDSLVNGEKALVVVPPHLMANWKHEVEKFTYLEIGKDIDIVPYTQLGNKVTSFEGYSFIVGDEAHYLKSMEAKRTLAFMNYLEDQRPEYFIYATGTPLKNRIPEIYTFLLMISGWPFVSPKIDVLYPTYYEFCERFCHVKTVGGRVKYHGMKNVEELKEYIKPWTIRRKPISSKGMVNQTVVASYKEDTALAKAWKLHESTGEFGGVDIVAKKEAAIAKAPFTAKWVEDEFNCEVGPIVVFSDHREPAIMIHDYLVKAQYRVGLIIGGGCMKKRDQLVLDFQAGLIDFIVSTSAGYTGLTLTRSNLVVVNDPPWVPADLDQLRGRVDRKTQDWVCRCVYIAGSRADDQIILSLGAKLKVITAVIGA